MGKQRVTRRQVLQGGCVAATTLAVPTIISASSLGAVGTPAPSDRINLGHIGVGARGSMLFGATQGISEVQSVAIADCFQNRRERKAGLCQGKAYDDFRELLERTDIDGVIIATPDHWHVPIAMMAARAGKDVYVEKPLGLTLEQSLACEEVFQKEKRIFQYGTQQRESQHMRFGHKLVSSGKLGEIKAIEIKAPNGGAGGSTVEAPVPEGFDYDMWLGPAFETPYTADRCKPKGTYWIYDYSIGYLGGWGAHPLDVMIWCYDGDQAGPFTVEGTGVIPTEGLYNTVIDWQLTIRMADGVNVRMTTGDNSTKFIGTEGKLELTRNSIRTFPNELNPGTLPGNNHMHNTQLHIKDFADSIRSRQSASSPVDESVRSDLISHLADIAIRTGEKITWDPIKQQIVGGSAQAKAMASRPMRAPWTL